MKVQIVYDDRASGRCSSCRTGKGFAALIDTGDRTILFDTGEEPKILMHNLDTLGIDPEEIDIIVISHEHRGHHGALEKLLILNDNVSLYIPRSMSSKFKDYFRSICSMVMEVSKPTQIIDGVYCTGDCVEEINEQSLVLLSKAGPVLLIGCAHPGMKSILDCTTALSDRPIQAIIGGFHIMDADSKVLETVKTMKQARVETIAPCHCTPDRARQILRSGYKDGYVEAGVGSTFTFT